ncbi:MAG: OadG family transporter subunit [Opitutales bacterium]
MIQSITVLAQLPDGAAVDPSAGGVVLVGFLFVIIVLGLLSAVTATMGAFFSKQAANSAAKAAVAAKDAAEASAPSTSEAAGTAPAAASDEEDPALIAVIAAAVHMAIGDRPHRVVSIRSAGPGWAQEGRRQIFSSHRVR